MGAALVVVVLGAVLGLGLAALVSVLPWYVAVERADRRGASTVRAGLVVIVLLAAASVAVLLGGLDLAPLLLLPWVAALIWPQLPDRIVGTTGRHVVGSASAVGREHPDVVRGDDPVAGEDRQSFDP